MLSSDTFRNCKLLGQVGRVWIRPWPAVQPHFQENCCARGSRVGFGVCPPVLIRERSSGPGVGYSNSDEKRKLETDVWVPHLYRPPLLCSPIHCCLLHPRACTLPGPLSYHWDHVISVMEGLSQPWETLDTEGSGGQPVRGRQRGVPCSPPPRPLSPALPISSWLSRPENPC